MMAKLPSEEVAMAFQMIRWASLVMTCCSPARRSYSQSLYGSASILATMVVARLKSVLRSGSAAPMTLFPHAMLASSSSAWWWLSWHGCHTPQWVDRGGDGSALKVHVGLDCLFLFGYSAIPLCVCVASVASKNYRSTIVGIAGGYQAVKLLPGYNFHCCNSISSTYFTGWCAATSASGRNLGQPSEQICQQIRDMAPQFTRTHI
jgi:hypothetical protein